ncbi:hypothetical protein RSOLAG22IIIB_13467 [Rhizoctonia solani]|uniref:Uncharacterized protein n=1 Tax=Rhizoctonia solani TaxID=456999 RepID=A0A0K6FMX5_9AGAM|nr:hypothetical protein RSOLAG22IIIB_13467 [Rhizoctonia solani]
MPSSSYLSYRGAHSRFVESLYDPSYAQEWRADDGGELCTSIATSMMQAGYGWLEGQVDRMIKPIRAARTFVLNMTSPGDLVGSLVKEMDTFSAARTRGRAPDAGTNFIGSGLPRGSNMEEAINLLNKGANLCKCYIIGPLIWEEITGAIQYIDNSTIGHRGSILSVNSRRR